MIRIFNHWFHWRPLAQALLDSSFVIVGVVIAITWTRQGLPIDHQQVILFGLIVIAVAMSLSSLIGLYQRIHTRTIIDARTQALLSIYLSFPIAYYSVSEWLQNYPYRIEIGVIDFVLTALITIMVALATVSFQTIKAALMNPVKSLKSE